MPRKVFLSFLGISNYDPVQYYPEGTDYSPDLPADKYVQHAILRYLTPAFGPEDAAYVFLTDQAETVNWLPDGHIDRQANEQIPNPGLKAELENQDFRFPVESRRVSGKSEEQSIWEIFQTVFACLQEQDEVYLDITHSWRYLPMLGMTLLNYAKAVRNISVKAIYYGAFEQLGSPFTVKTIPENKRPVPILNMVSFSELQDWAVAADDFVQDGNPDRLTGLANRQLSPFLRKAAGTDEIANNLRNISRHLGNLVPLIQTNRGQKIWNYPYDELQSELETFSPEQSYVKPLSPIVNLLQEKVADFQPVGNLQWLASVQWCIQHRLIQQGVTQLQEGLLSWLCRYFSGKQIAPRGYFDMTNERPRNLLSGAMAVINKQIPKTRWSGAAGKRPGITTAVIDDPVMVTLAPIYNTLVGMRNDINHGGYTNNTGAKKFVKNLKDNYQRVRDVLEKADKNDLAPQLTGLLNLSNHPSTRWSDPQLEIARAEYDDVQDLPFPHINPAWTQQEIQALVDEYYQKIVEMNPAAVHLMGEMTFTFALVKKLKAAGIPCIASTTERKVEETDGKKIVHFNFVQFRPY